jgi:hypothetical protein
MMGINNVLYNQNIVMTKFSVINITNNVISKDRKIDEYIKSLLSGELCDNQTDSGNGK